MWKLKFTAKSESLRGRCFVSLPLLLQCLLQWEVKNLITQITLQSGTMPFGMKQL